MNTHLTCTLILSTSYAIFACSIVACNLHIFVLCWLYLHVPNGRLLIFFVSHFLNSSGNNAHLIARQYWILTSLHKPGF